MRFEVGSRDSTRRFGRCLLITLLLTPLTTRLSFTAPQAPATRSAPVNVADLDRRAAAAMAASDYPQAIRLYLKALRLRPQWPEGWQKVGTLLADRKEYARAEAAFRNLVDIEPKNGAGWALLGLCEFEQGRYDEAYGHIRHGGILGVGSAELETVSLYHAALVMIVKGEFEVAQRHLSRLAHYGVGDEDVVLAFGLTALRIASLPDKVSGPERELALRVGKIDFDAVHARFADTVAAYNQLLAEFPGRPRLHFAFGNALLNGGHFEQALEQMQKELELNPDHTMALLQSALTWVRLSQPERALPFAERAVRLGPKSFAAHYVFGWTLFKLGQNERAIPELEQSVKLEPNSPLTHYALSQAYMRAGRKQDGAREREIFARLSQKTTPPGSATGGREYSGTPAENLPLRPEE
jgi:tetratricopeptide (TPR) repeat protein